MMETIQNGSLLTRKFESLDELQEWSKLNITNPKVLKLIMQPIKPNEKSLKSVKQG